MGSGQWAVGSGQGAVGSGQWTVGSGQWAVGSGQWAVDSGQWAVGRGQWARDRCTSCVSSLCQSSLPPPALRLRNNFKGPSILADGSNRSPKRTGAVHLIWDSPLW
jgi:hypothetical protein